MIGAAIPMALFFASWKEEDDQNQKIRAYQLAHPGQTIFFDHSLPHTIIANTNCLVTHYLRDILCVRAESIPKEK
jgi:hypothetical protein